MYEELTKVQTINNNINFEGVVVSLHEGEMGLSWNKRTKMGNVIAPVVALGMSIGRLRCFFNGCCYGIASTWGFDFGDGILRYPTQLFEDGFHLAAFLLLHILRLKVKKPGILFKYYVLTNFIFRFFIEFIRENPIYSFELTLYQLICIAGIIFVSANLFIRMRKEGIVNGWQ